MSYPVTIKDIPPHIRGDRWLGIHSIGPVLINGTAPENILTRIRMHFVCGNQTFRLDSDSGTSPDAPIVIDDAATWEAHVDEIENFLPSAGVWSWDMEFYEDGKTNPLTLYQGQITVKDDKTR